MKPLTAKEVERYLKAYGYKLDRIRGSHHVWVNDAGTPSTSSAELIAEGAIS